MPQLGLSINLLSIKGILRKDQMGIYLNFYEYSTLAYKDINSSFTLLRFRDEIIPLKKPLRGAPDLTGEDEAISSQ